MPIEEITATIQAILAPAVLTTTCGVMLNGLFSYYGGINERLRSMAQERIALLRALQQDSTDHLIHERLSEVDFQIPELLRRHKLVHDGLLAVFLSLIVFIISMFIIAAAAFSGMVWVANAALITFLCGTCVLFAGCCLIAYQLRISHTLVHYEAQRVCELRPGEPVPAMATMMEVSTDMDGKMHEPPADTRT